MVKFKVLHIFKSYFPETTGGVEQVIRQISLAGLERGVQADIFTLVDGPSHCFEFEGQLVHGVKRHFQLASTGFSFSALWAFRRLAENYDLLHFHYPWPFADLLNLLAGVSKPTVLTYHSDIVKQQALEHVYRPLQQHFLRSMNKIAVTSPNYLQSSTVLADYVGKSSIVPIGLNKASYPDVSAEQVAAIKAKHGDEFFLFVGVLRYYKGLHSLLAAVKDSSIKVLIAGSGPLLQELKTQLEEQQLEANVVFLGQVSEEDKVALLQACRALVFPSSLRSEAFGVSLLEAAMFAKPMISCEIGTGTTYINLANETGLVVPPESPEALRSALLTLLSDDALCAEMGKKAEQRYQRYFTDRVMFDGYYRLYQDLLSTPID